MIVEVPETPPVVAVIVALPPAGPVFAIVAVAAPVEVTDTSAGLLDVHVKVRPATGPLLALNAWAVSDFV